MRQFFRCILLFPGFILFLANPQFVYGLDSDQPSESRFGIRSIGVSLGWYKPGMDYWNSTYFAENQWENKFKGSFVYTGFIELNIVKNLRIKTSGTYWTETVKSGVIPMNVVTGTEKLSTTLTFISLDVIYRLGFLSFESFSPYIGVGGSFVFVQNKFTRSPENSAEEQYTNKGQDVTGTVLAGLERKFGEHFAAAVDFRYIIGNYTQEMKDISGNISSHPVSLNGPQIGLNLSYIFK